MYPSIFGKTIEIVTIIVSDPLKNNQNVVACRGNLERQGFLAKQPLSEKLLDGAQKRFVPDSFQKVVKEARGIQKAKDRFGKVVGPPQTMNATMGASVTGSTGLGPVMHGLVANGHTVPHSDPEKSMEEIVAKSRELSEHAWRKGARANRIRQPQTHPPRKPNAPLGNRLEHVVRLATKPWVVRRGGTRRPAGPSETAVASDNPSQSPTTDG